MPKLLVCVIDMWDKHWCKTHNQKVAKKAVEINAVLQQLREKECIIVHCPAAPAIDAYADHKCRCVSGKPPASRRWGKSIGNSKPCECPDNKCKPSSVWTRQNQAIQIDNTDYICNPDDAQDLQVLLDRYNTKEVMLMGTALNMCVLGRDIGVISLLDKGLQVSVATDMCLVYGPPSLRQATEKMMTKMGAKICTTDQMLRLL